MAGPHGPVWASLARKLGDNLGDEFAGLGDNLGDKLSRSRVINLVLRVIKVMNLRTTFLFPVILEKRGEIEGI